MEKDITVLQKSIEQIGIEPAKRMLPPGYRLGRCPGHGYYITTDDSNAPQCPLCLATADSGNGNGTTATEVELFIDLDKVLGYPGLGMNRCIE